MKKVFLLATAALVFTSVTFAQEVTKQKKCAKGKSCCNKTATAEKAGKTKTAKI